MSILSTNMSVPLSFNSLISHPPTPPVNLKTMKKLNDFWEPLWPKYVEVLEKENRKPPILRKLFPDLSFLTEEQKQTLKAIMDEYYSTPAWQQYKDKHRRWSAMC